MYKTREKYYIIIMIYKTTKEYRQALKQFARLRKDYSTPVLTLDEMYDSFVEEEYNRMQDAAIDRWLNGLIIDEVFSTLFLNEKMRTNAEKIVNIKIQREE